MPEQRAEAAAREAFVLADRRPDRGAQRFEARVRVFLTSVLDHRPTWRPAQQRAVSTATDEIRGLIDQLSVAFHRLAVERRLLAGLDSVPSNGPVSMIRFSDIDVQDAAREDAAGDVARAAQLGSAHGGALVGSARRPSVDRLLALLARAVREAG